MITTAPATQLSPILLRTLVVTGAWLAFTLAGWLSQAASGAAQTETSGSTARAVGTDAVVVGSPGPFALRRASQPQRTPVATDRAASNPGPNPTRV